MGLLVFLALYFAPTSVALLRRKRNGLAILVANLLLGWTVIGWIGCMIWAVLKDQETEEIAHGHHQV